MRWAWASWAAVRSVGAMVSARAEHVLVVVVVEVAAGEDLAGLGDADVLVAERAELELAAADELLDDHVVVELEGGGDGVAERRRRRRPWRRRWTSRGWRA